MKTIFLKISALTLVILTSLGVSYKVHAQEFQGKAYYISKSVMNLGSFGARMSEAQKKQMQSRMKNRLEKTFVLTFNKEESMFKEDEKLDAISGATDSWGKNFAAGDQYKNVKTNTQVQSQEFYGKQFLVKDKLQPIEWKMGSETKQIGKYTCFKAMALIPTSELTWYSFSWSSSTTAANEKENETSEGETKVPEIKMTQVEAWYTMQIPVRHGPSEYWGLPGLILEVSAGDTTMLCSKIIMNPEEKFKIEAPEKGKEVTKKIYQKTISEKMQEFRNNRGRSRG